MLKRLKISGTQSEIEGLHCTRKHLAQLSSLSDVVVLLRRSRSSTEQHSSFQESADALNDEEEQQLADQLARVRSRRAEVRQERVAVSEQ
jgi:hypothetical protein